jgi:uncharacterized protein YbbC (DUF1343 family)
MSLMTGLDRLSGDGFAPLLGKQIAVVCNQASVDSQFRHILDLLESGNANGDYQLKAVLGPQHGLFGTTQENMIEWEGEGALLRFPVYSLYGEHREPTDVMLEGVDLILVDLPDVGSRYYTFIWTLSLVMKAAQRLGISLLILDRPNPIGSAVEGTVLDPDFRSFVGLHPLPLRHGMTIGEIGLLVQRDHYPRAKLDVLKMTGWDRDSYGDQNGYAWVMPSPNMPTVDTAVVYPGGCLIEGTNLSEGRGTTRPFEIIGAPWLNGQQLAERLNARKFPGVYFRAVQFEPTFNKYVGQICNGVFVHVIDRNTFRPVLSYLALIRECIRQTGLHESSHAKLEKFKAASPETELPGFAWKQPPYEYEFSKMPIDILLGNGWMRPLLEQETDFEFLQKTMENECNTFISHSKSCKIYEEGRRKLGF